MGSSPFWNTRTIRPESGWEKVGCWFTGGAYSTEGWMMMEYKHYGELMIKIHLTDMMKLVVEIEYFGMSVDDFDKETMSSDGLQPKQAHLSCVHALNEPHLHEIHVVPSKHEADQHSLCANP
uniref:Uncharacterized protein n=1 Tax=Tanacetum cinerariifolium TaxID=118510 RepID=A0A6L2P3L3_TANCI|nr:hypothetical protein [Tanacetum cinerariifolium]